MRVELVYAPGCTSYGKALRLLETVIAEERLPIPVELCESKEAPGPQILLNGEKLTESAHHCMEELRNKIAESWSELSSKMLRQN